MSIKKITVKTIENGNKGEAELYLLTSSNSECHMKILINGTCRVEVSDFDFFSCFSKARKELKDITFLCKGAKRNVYPSNMSRQMSLGMVAYECTLGKQATREDIVKTFDFDDLNLVTDPDEQKEFHYEWLKSF
ncbi:hypothetical protein EAE91_23315 [Photorhabdus noenieputensis]|uniref:hypothetical protein n=1 Tax=Photorhabdus noenieputensis TaxID=1208607 RepID=UPI001FD3B423|nr:hypothetical protein [Photorhabdus noenieputensis]MBS9439966.1 hypothetical protein [Photorhabdus noenieputensis]MCK3669895.1 hypothetical protein [Photorhabdus noenieputensis]